jgi:hypothetical protein
VVQDFNLNGTNDSRHTTAWDLTTPLTPAGMTGTSARFFGGIYALHNDNTSTPTRTVETVATGDQLYYSSQYIATSPIATDRVAVVWLKDDFLGGASSQTVSFTSGSSLRLQSWTNTATLYTMNVAFRFLVRDGGGWYVSSNRLAFTVGAAQGANSLTLSNPNALSWAAYTPADGNGWIQASPSAGWTTHTFTNVTAAGFLAERNGSGNMRTFVDAFEVTANVIPEPATAGLIALAAGVLFRRRSRR